MNNTSTISVDKVPGSEIDMHLLQTLVPVNALTIDHLKTLLRDRSVEMVCTGQKLFELGEYDNNHVYLLSGKVKVTGTDGSEQLISAEDPGSRFPLESHQPRRHTVTAVTDCSVVRFGCDELDAMLAWDQASNYIMLDIASQRDLDEDADWMLTLLKSNLFYKVPPMNIREIINKFKPEVLPTGTTVIRQGEVGNCCYFIKEGLLGVYQSKDEKCSPELVAELGVGRCFGEDALVNETVRNATIEVHANAVLMKLDKSDFFILLKQPQVETCSFAQAQLQAGDNKQWLDVRTQDEFEKGHLCGALNMPLDLLKLKSRLLDKNLHYILYCNSGRRSEAAAYFLGEEGFKVSALLGGIESCSVEQQALFDSVNF